MALILPVHKAWFRIAVVPGQTPFLLSSSFLRTVQAAIDADAGTLWSKTLGMFLDTSKSPSNLMLLDINQLWPQDVSFVQDTVQVQGSKETHSLQTESFETPCPAVKQNSVSTAEGNPSQI